MPTALQSYLMYKQAAFPFRSLIGKGVDWAGKQMPTRAGVKKFFIGEPRKFLSELNEGKTWAPGSVLREGMKTPGMLSKALVYGLPAAEMVREIRDDRPDKAKRIGELLGGTALGLGTWGPGGIIGSMAAGGLGAYIGGTGGRLLEHLTRPAPEYPEAINQIYQQ